MSTVVWGRSWCEELVVEGREEEEEEGTLVETLLCEKVGTGGVIPRK